jgi:hypothetical protein
MYISTKKVKLVKHVRGLRFATQFLPMFLHRVFLGGVR